MMSLPLKLVERDGIGYGHDLTMDNIAYDLERARVNSAVRAIRPDSVRICIWRRAYAVRRIHDEQGHPDWG